MINNLLIVAALVVGGDGYYSESSQELETVVVPSASSQGPSSTTHTKAPQRTQATATAEASGRTATDAAVSMSLADHSPTDDSLVNLEVAEYFANPDKISSVQQSASQPSELDANAYFAEPVKLAAASEPYQDAENLDTASYDAPQHPISSSDTAPVPQPQPIHGHPAAPAMSHHDVGHGHHNVHESHHHNVHESHHHHEAVVEGPVYEGGCDGCGGCDSCQSCGGGCGECHTSPCCCKKLFYHLFHKGFYPSPCYSPGNMPQHFPYIAAPKNYYYFRPYHWMHIADQQLEVERYGGDPRHPYKNDLFEGVYREIEAR